MRDWIIKKLGGVPQGDHYAILTKAWDATDKALEASVNATISRDQHKRYGQQCDQRIDALEADRERLNERVNAQGETLFAINNALADAPGADKHATPGEHVKALVNDADREATYHNVLVDTVALFIAKHPWIDQRDVLEFPGGAIEHDGQTVELTRSTALGLTISNVFDEVSGRVAMLETVLETVGVHLDSIERVEVLVGEVESVEQFFRAQGYGVAVDKRDRADG